MEYSKGCQDFVSPHFRALEFDCPCSNCKTTLIDQELVDKLETMRSLMGSMIRINSGYRCKEHQEELRLRGAETSIGPSTHEQGRAADVTNGVSLGIELEDAARKAGFKAVGVGKGWVHVDLRGPEVRSWKYSY